jgi:hypothetical protein
MAINLTSAVTKTLYVAQTGVRGELRDQGHRLTGGLIENIEVVVSEQGDTVTGKLIGPDYAIYVDAGVPANRVRYPVKIMIEYFQKRGLAVKDATRAAWATRAKHKIEGIPTKASFRFSKNGRRTGFIKAGIEAKIQEMQRIFADEIGGDIDIEITQIFNTGERRAFSIEF